jgi:GNAT superfamily N-acetyltransferase
MSSATMVTLKVRFRRACDRVRRTYRTQGVSTVLRKINRIVVAALYQRDAQHIFVWKIPASGASVPHSEAAEGLDVACMFVESAAAFRAIERELPLSIRDSADQLRQRLAQGCSVIVVRKPSRAGHEVIGYGINEPGVFSALGRRGQLFPDVLFNHYIEVLPEYRGQRIAHVMRSAMDEYCRMHGFTKRCTVVSPSNEASLRSTGRSGLVRVGMVARVSLLGGLFVWETPLETIRRAVQAVDHQERPTADS